MFPYLTVCRYILILHRLILKPLRVPACKPNPIQFNSQATTATTLTILPNNEYIPCHVCLVFLYYFHQQSFGFIVTQFSGVLFYLQYINTNIHMWVYVFDYPLSYLTGCCAILKWPWRILVGVVKQRMYRMLYSFICTVSNAHCCHVYLSHFSTLYNKSAWLVYVWKLFNESNVFANLL